MVTKLQDIANQVAEENISTNPRLRNEEIRRRMYGDWEEPVIQPEEAPGGLQDATKQDTLAKTYAALKNNYDYINNAVRNTTGQTYQVTQPTSVTSAPLSNTPRWMPSAVGYGLSALGHGKYAAMGAGATQLLQGNIAGAAGTLANIFTNTITEGKVPGLGGLAGTLASGLVKGKSASEMGYDISNSLLGTGLGMVNPALGLGYNLAQMFGLNVSRGISDYSKSDINQRFDAGYNGGFWGDGSWTPTAPYSPTNTYSGSGYGNTAGPGSGGYKGESSYGGYSPTMNYSSNSDSYWSGPSTSSSSSSYSSSGYPSGGSWSSYSSGSAYSSDSDSESSDGGW